MDVTYEWTDELAWKFYYCVCHELKSRLLGKLFLLLYKQGWNLILIVSNHFDVMWINGHKLKIPLLHCNQARIFELLLLGQIRWYPGFSRWSISFTKNKTCKEVDRFYWKICIALLCSVFADLVTYENSIICVVII